MKSFFSNIKEKYGIWIFVSIGLIAILGVALYFIISQHNAMNEFKTQVAIEEERRALEAEYANLAFEYDQFEGSKIYINNDTLIQQLENEKQKVKRLLEELKTTKASNAKRIEELKNELNTLRSVMKGYLIQIDSLNHLNQKLEKENKIVKSKYQEAEKTASQLKKDKEELTHQVTLASKLDAVGISVKTLNSKGKETSKIKKIEHIQINFLIAKNITANPGERNVYVRIIKPDNDVLIKNRNDVFTYEDSEINYSIKKLIAYENEETTVDMYWQVKEFLEPGTYKVEIFADGDMIGKKSFSIE
jgi:cell division protein FtsL